jgi:hypothetical protein
MKKTPRDFTVENLVEVEVTQEEYDAEVAAGVEPEFRVKPGRHNMAQGRFNLSPKDRGSENVRRSSSGSA